MTTSPIVGFLVATCTLAACATVTSTPVPTATRPNVLTTVTIALPTPRAQGTLTLEETLARRRSVREFADTPLTLAELGQLLWAAQGITSSAGQRTAPSAGALYPLEVYAVTRDAAYHYEPDVHRLTVHAQGDLRRALYEVALRQDLISRAPTTIVIAAVYARTAIKYGDERAPRYVALEAGHAAQNVLLQAVALDLGAVPIGAFEDEKVKQVLALPRDHQPLYLIPAGHPGGQ